MKPALTPMILALYKQQVKAYWYLYLIGFSALAFTNLAEVLMPKFAQWSLDTVTLPRYSNIPSWLVADSKSQTLYRLSIGFGLSMAFGWLGRWLWRQSLARRTHIAGRDFRIKYWDSLRYFPDNFATKFTIGDLISRGIADLNAVRFVLGMTLVLTFDILLFITFACFFMFQIDPSLALACLLPFPFFFPLIWFYARKQEKSYGKAQRKLGQLSELIAQSLSMVRLQRATATEDVWVNKLNQEAQNYAKRNIKFLRTVWKIFPLATIPSIFSYGILVILGMQKLQAGQISTGQFLAFFSYILLMQNPLYELSQCIAEWQKGIVGLKRMQEIFLLKPDEPTIMAYQTGHPQIIELRDVKISYGEDRLLLQDINLSLGKGSKVGILGAVGSGKTTLLKVLSGDLKSISGEINYFGMPISRFSVLDFSNVVSIVPQKAFLFAGSIRYNLCLDQDFDDVVLWDILEVVQLRKELEAIPQGLDNWIGEWGVSLSGGQKQRLALARALLRKKPIMLFDDCFSAVDVITEEIILNNLKSYLPEETVVIWVAHRRSTLKNCPLIYAIENGILVEVGSG